MPFALIIVSVPARVAVIKGGSNSGVPTTTAAKGGSTGGAVVVSSGNNNNVVTPVASKVRQYIVDSNDCTWISEEPFLNGKAWWTSFMFSCKAGVAEQIVSDLCELGVGATVAAAAGMEPKGKGMVLVLPIKIQRVGSLPKAFGHPDSMQYGTTVPSSAVPPPPSPPESPSPPATSVKEVPSLDSDAVVAPAPSSPRTDSTGQSVTDAEIEEDIQGQMSATEVKDGKHGKMKLTESFHATIKSRISVDSMIQYVFAASEFSFDYVMLILCASIIACTGLVTNNTVVIVASMLVSPLMGPILACTFGAVICDRALIKRGNFAETVGLLLCILSGFVGGLCAAPFVGHSWPTQEMASRGVPSALWTGVAIAVPSGFGAALSVTGSNTSSLVGVAISASLLPPAVNCGVLLAAIALQNTGLVATDTQVVVNGSLQSFEKTAPIISLCVTIINIILINICASIMFIIKGLGSHSEFYNTHIKNVRKYNRAIRDPERRSKYEQAFRAAKEERSDSHHPAPLENLKVSLKWNPFNHGTTST